MGRMDRTQIEYVRVSGGGDCAEESWGRGATVERWLENAFLRRSHD